MTANETADIHNNANSDEPSAGETHEFQAEVARLLNMMVRSVYSETEIFLRELISNASDACDRLRYAALTDDTLTGGDNAYRIDITVDPAKKTITVADNGIGMDRDDLNANLGTIAKSGTAAFLEQLSGEAQKDVSLIGQFGVGFYSAFMVADHVDVMTRKAGQNDAWHWASDGQGTYSITPATKDNRGTAITLHVRDDAAEFLAPERLRHIVTTYSDHIAFPIHLFTVKEDAVDEEEGINQGSALWMRPKSEVTDEQYETFYRHVGHAFDKPAVTLHYRAEGTIEYAALLFVPETAPFDLFDPARKPRVKLYVKRVFITDDTGELIPGYLRFLRGVIDSEDLPLNISREMLQNNPVVARIRKAVTGRVISELEKLAGKDAEKYNALWEQFGPVLKEGIYEDDDRRDALLDLARFRTTADDGWISLKDYTAQMQADQKAIYYVSAPDLEAARRSPHLEGFTARNIPVLLLGDPVDEFWLSTVADYEGTPFQSVTKGDADLSPLSDAEAGDETKDTPDEANTGLLIAAVKEALGDAVKDVRTTNRLTDSAVCLVADEADMDINLQRILKQSNQLSFAAPRILELNPKHPLIEALTARAGESGAMDALKDPAHLLLDQARILEGEPPADPAAFAKRLSDLMVQIKS